VVSEGQWHWEKTFFSETRGCRCKKVRRHLFSASPLRACHLTRAGRFEFWEIKTAENEDLPWNLEAMAPGAGTVSMLSYFLNQNIICFIKPTTVYV